MRTKSTLHRLTAPGVPILLLALTALLTACGVSTQAGHPVATPSPPAILYLSALVPPASSTGSAPSSVVYALDAPTGKQIWQAKLTDLVSQTSLSGDTLYVATTASTSSSTAGSSKGPPSGTVSALDARTGAQRWSLPTGKQVSAIVATSTAIVVAETTAPPNAPNATTPPTVQLVALGATDGKPLWTSASYQGSVTTGSLVVFGATAYLITATVSSTAPTALPTSTVTALNTADGTERWHAQFSLVVTALAADTQLVGVSSQMPQASETSLPATTLMVLNPTDGTTVWHTQVPSFVTALTVDQDTVYATALTPSIPSAGVPGSLIMAFSGTDGTQRWSISTADITQGVAVSGTTLVTSLNPISSGATNVLALHTSDGSPRWKMPGAGALLTAPTVANGTIYVAGFAATGTTSGVEALSVSTGSLQWQVQVTGLVQPSSLLAA
jgi:outer membrane protein assembly factor BamB